MYKPNIEVATRLVDRGGLAGSTCFERKEDRCIWSREEDERAKSERRSDLYRDWSLLVLSLDREKVENQGEAGPK
jgi:hypothetical protein